MPNRRRDDEGAGELGKARPWVVSPRGYADPVPLSLWSDWRQKESESTRSEEADSLKALVERFPLPPNPTEADEADRLFYVIEGGIKNTRRRLVESGIQEVLNEMTGRSFGSFEANKLVAVHIQRIANSLHMVFECPRPGCGKPARLRFFQPGRSPGGIFRFEHSFGGRKVNHGSYNTIPPLKLIPHPDEAQPPRVTRAGDPPSREEKS